jgi:hypothetical protein
LPFKAFFNGLFHDRHVLIATEEQTARAGPRPTISSPRSSSSNAPLKCIQPIARPALASGPPRERRSEGCLAACGGVGPLKGVPQRSCRKSPRIIAAHFA